MLLIEGRDLESNVDEDYCFAGPADELAQLDIGR